MYTYMKLEVTPSTCSDWLHLHSITNVSPLVSLDGVCTVYASCISISQLYTKIARVSFHHISGTLSNPTKSFLLVKIWGFGQHSLPEQLFQTHLPFGISRHVHVCFGSLSTNITLTIKCQTGCTMAIPTQTSLPWKCETPWKWWYRICCSLYVQKPVTNMSHSHTNCCSYVHSTYNKRLPTTILPLFILFTTVMQKTQEKMLLTMYVEWKS